MQLALALDGVNPFKLSNTNWSTWPGLILIYNFESWLVTKKFFISLSILILGKHSPLSSNIDVSIRPLLRELQELWCGVIELDFSQLEGNHQFTLRALLMWTISDFPAYKLISGLCCKGYKGCPYCGPDTDACMAKIGDVLHNRIVRGSKIVYGGICRYLLRNHPYHRNRRFNGMLENREAPQIQTSQDIIHAIAWRQSYLDLGGQENGPDDPIFITVVKRLSALYELYYWQVSFYCTLTLQGLRLNHRGFRLCPMTSIGSVMFTVVVGDVLFDVFSDIVYNKYMKWASHRTLAAMSKGTQKLTLCMTL